MVEWARIPDPVVAVRTLLSRAAADAGGRAVLLDRAAAAARSVVHAEPRAAATIAVVRAAVAAGLADTATRVAEAAEPGLRAHLREFLAAELARHGSVDRALAIVDGIADPRRKARAHAEVAVERARREPGGAAALAETVADPAARVRVLLAAGLLDRALAVPLSSGDVGRARTGLAVALAGRGDFAQALEMLEKIPGRRRRAAARRDAMAAALPVPAAVVMAARFPGWERDRCVADLAVRAAGAGRLDHAVAIAEVTGRRTEALSEIAVVTAERGDVAAATRLVADHDLDTETTLRMAGAVARHGDRDTAITMMTAHAGYARREVHHQVYEVAPGARAAAAAGDLARTLAIVGTVRHWNRDVVLRGAAIAAARHGQPRTALALAPDIADHLLVVFAARGDLAHALALVGEHIPRDRRLTVIVRIGRALVRAGRLPAAGLLDRAGPLAGETVHDTLRIAELAAVEGRLERGLAMARQHPAVAGRIAAAAAAQGRFDEAPAIRAPSHALIMATAVGGRLDAALAMAAGPDAIARRDIVTDVCRVLAAAGRIEPAVDAAAALPLRQRVRALRLAAVTAAQHGRLAAAAHVWDLVGGADPAGVAEVAVLDLDAALAVAGTVADDAFGSRDHAHRVIARVAADRGLAEQAAAALAGIEYTRWTLGPTWRYLASRFDREQLRATAAAYLTRRGT